MSTIRAHLEAIRDRHKPYDRFDVHGQPLPAPGCQGCPWPISWPCANHADAVAGIKCIEDAERERLLSHFGDQVSYSHGPRVLVPDPLPASIVAPRETHTRDGEHETHT